MSLAARPLRPFRVASVTAVADPDGAPRHEIRLDGKPMAVGAAQAALRCRTAAAAQAVAAELTEAARGADLRPEALPLTRIAATAQGHVAPNRAGAIEDLLGFAASDLLRHRAEGPAGVVARETACWQPPLDWAAAALGAVLPPVTGVMPAAPGADALGALARALSRESDEALAVLLAIVPTLGSLVLGLAVIGGAIDPADAASAALLEATIAADAAGDEREERRVAAERRRLADTIRQAAAFLATVR